MSTKFKLNDKVLHEGKLAIVAGLGPYGVIAIERGDGIGWQRGDGQVDKSYISTLDDRYWNSYEEALSEYIEEKKESSDPNMEDKLLKLGLDGIELLKELKGRKQVEIEAIDGYLKSIEDLLNPPHPPEEQKPEEKASEEESPKESAEKSQESQGPKEKSKSLNSTKTEQLKEKNTSKSEDSAKSESESFGESLKESTSSGVEAAGQESIDSDSELEPGEEQEELEVMKIAFKEMMDSLGIPITKSLAPMKNPYDPDWEPSSGDSTIGEVGDNETAGKIFCGVCNRHHTKGTHD